MDWRSPLGVVDTDTHANIARKYKKLILKTHPNKGGDAARFRDVREAWETYQDSRMWKMQVGRAVSREMEALGMTPSKLYPLTELLKRQFKGNSRRHVWKMASSDGLRRLTRSRFTRIGWYLSTQPKVRNTLSFKDRMILQSRLKDAIATSLRGLQRAMSLQDTDADIFWYTLALFVALDYQEALVQSRRIPGWPMRLDVKMPGTTKLPGLRYKIPDGFQHIHDGGVIGMTNGFGSRYASLV